MIIYKTVNLINGKIYIGKQIKNVDKYLGSGQIIKDAIKKYGRKSFIKEIIDTAETIEELNEKEIYWIEKLDSRNKSIGYNISIGGESVMQNRSHTTETKLQIKTTLTGRKYSEERCLNMGAGRKGLRTFGHTPSAATNILRNTAITNKWESIKLLNPDMVSIKIYASIANITMYRMMKLISEDTIQVSIVTYGKRKWRAIDIKKFPI